MFKVQCSEVDITGVRDTLVLAQLMSGGAVKFDGDHPEPTGWLDDPYDPSETGAMTRNKAERPEYDAQFPNHPLSRAPAGCLTILNGQ